MTSICVYCGSSSGHDDKFRHAAIALGEAIAKRGWRVVYGGASVGLMGAVADAALAQGGTVVGVLPKALQDKELAHTGLSELHIVASMHERKAMMADLSDGFVALPGGVGTLEEIFEVWTWAQLGYHAKPCAFLNTDGYYDDLFSFLNNQVKQGFVKDVHRKMVVEASQADQLLDAMQSYEAPTVAKWIDRQST